MTPSNPARRGASLRAGLLLAAGLAVAQSGCNYVIALGYLIGGPPSIEPDFDKQTAKSFTDKDVTVAIVCHAPTELKWDFDEIDFEIAKYVTYRLAAHKIKVIDPDTVRAWLDRNPDWDRAEEVGEALDATYVVFIDLHKYSLYAENSSVLYQGSAEALISVYEMSEDGEGEKIYSKDFSNKYPLAVPRSTSETTYTNFKREFLSRLSEEIGRHFYEYYNGDDIGAVI
jgi:hypothetical protein